MTAARLPVCLLVVAAACVGPARAAEPAAEQVIDRCVEALGGAAPWHAIESLEITGRHTSFSHTEPFYLARRRPDLYRFDHNETTFKLTVAYDGQTAWWQTAVPLISNASWPVEMPAIYAPVIELDVEFDPPFIDYRQKGHEIELIGETEFEGEPYLELRIRRRQQPDAVERWFLDRTSFLPLLRVARGTYHGYHSEQKTYFLDYREVAGARMPYRLETELGNDFLVLEVAGVRVNVELDAGLFKRPLPAGMERLRTLAGRWRVVIGNRDDPALHAERVKAWTEDETVAVISSRFAGSLLEEEIAVATARPRQVRRWWTYDRFRDVFRLAHFDTFSQHLDVLEGTMTNDGRLVVSDLGTATPTRVYTQTTYVRETLHDVEPDSFQLDRDISTDGGETWTLDLRLTYTRMRDVE